MEEMRNQKREKKKRTMREDKRKLSSLKREKRVKI